MAKPNNSGWILIALLLIPIFYLLKYLIRESTKFIPMHEYALWALVLVHFAQLYFFFSKSYDKLRKERKGEVRYQLYVPPQYKSMIISFTLGIFCSGFVLFLNTDSMARVIGMVITIAVFFGAGFASAQTIINYGKSYIKITDEEFFCRHKGKEIKILFSEVEWVDYMTKMMDARRGWEKIGIVFKLVDGREQEVYTWKWGFTQEKVTELMQDIGAKMAR